MIIILPINRRPKCKYLTCFAGAGLAGGSCFLFGEPKNPDCPEYIEEEEALREWRERWTKAFIQQMKS